jgi:hypothetical protein
MKGVTQLQQETIWAMGDLDSFGRSKEVRCASRTWLWTVQYSSGSITVRTRVVTVASAGSGDNSSMSES